MKHYNFREDYDVIDLYRIRILHKGSVIPNTFLISDEDYARFWYNDLIEDEFIVGAILEHMKNYEDNPGFAVFEVLEEYGTAKEGGFYEIYKLEMPE